MKKYNIKRTKRYAKEKRKKRKRVDVHCKGEKVIAFESVRKIL